MKEKSFIMRPLSSVLCKLVSVSIINTMLASVSRQTPSTLFP